MKMNNLTRIIHGRLKTLHLYKTCLNATKKQKAASFPLKNGYTKPVIFKICFLIVKEQNILFQFWGQTPNICECFIKLTNIWTATTKFKRNVSSRFY